ncbi:hypothetical protein CRG98_008911 [Punica granatum]|uniref:Uncharacterized protein n=1 Tax=Punica granatum TaxID=22663 RepID=A0A2I0KQA5_PUNGR|nr:hypothetical protein CRG98_008911 [Punica granatum]
MLGKDLDDDVQTIARPENLAARILPKYESILTIGWHQERWLEVSVAHGLDWLVKDLDSFTAKLDGSEMSSSMEGIKMKCSQIWRNLTKLSWGCLDLIFVSGSTPPSPLAARMLDFSNGHGISRHPPSVLYACLLVFGKGQWVGLHPPSVLDSRLEAFSQVFGGIATPGALWPLSWVHFMVGLELSAALLKYECLRSELANCTTNTLSACLHRCSHF